MLCVLFTFMTKKNTKETQIKDEKGQEARSETHKKAIWMKRRLLLSFDAMSDFLMYFLLILVVYGRLGAGVVFSRLHRALPLAQFSGHCCSFAIR